MNQVNPRDRETVWRELKAIFEDAYEGRDVTSDRFMRLYTEVYNLCSSSGETIGRERSLMSLLVRPFKRKLPPAEPNQMCRPFPLKIPTFYKDVASRIKNHIVSLMENILKDKVQSDLAIGEEVFYYYVDYWRRIKFSTKVLDGIFLCVNRQLKLSGNTVEMQLGEFYQLALDTWKKKFYQPLSGLAIRKALHIIRNDREGNGDEINLDKVGVLTDSLVELGVYEQSIRSTESSNTDYLTPYEYFEDLFLRETRDFYTSRCDALLQEKSCLEFMKMVMQWINQEKDRVSRYLHPSTMESLMGTCDYVLIARQVSRLHNEFPALLRQEDEAELMENMRTIYYLVSRVNSFGNMFDVFQDHVTRVGSAALQHILENQQYDPTEYISKLLEVFRSFGHMVETAFKRENGFRSALDRACMQIVNLNGDSPDVSDMNKCPAFLARYCDLLLRKTTEDSPDKLTTLLDETVNIYKYIEDRDVFQKLFSQLYVCRLVGSLSVSDEAEDYIITKLSSVDGTSVKDLNRLCQDFKMVKGTNENLKEWLKNKELEKAMAVDLEVTLLSTAAWPFNWDENDDKFLLPPELGDCVTTFTQYYGERHTGRKLSWIHSKSRVDVKVNCFKTRHIFVLSTYRAAILLQFNTQPTHSVDELVQATQLPEDIVLQILESFLRARILQRQASQDGNALTLDSAISLNENFQSKKYKMVFTAPVKVQRKAEEEKAQTSIDRGRSMEIQAAIVRVMKQHKVLNHQQLVVETVNGLKGRFKPIVSQINTSIAPLVDKEYLAKEDGEPCTYRYIS